MNPRKNLRCDLHIHSCLSPCADLLMTPGNIIKQAVKAGLDYIAITDHNSAGNIPVARKLAERSGIKLIPAMEVETREEVHLLCYFPSLEPLQEMESIVAQNLPDLQNDEEYFGYQLLTNINDQYIAKEERLLAAASMLTFTEIVETATKLGGVVIPSHVDRKSNSVLTHLGFIPPNAEIKVIEVSPNTDPVEFLRIHPELNQYMYIQGSDSHYLDDIGRCSRAGGFVINDQLHSLLRSIL